MRQTLKERAPICWSLPGYQKLLGLGQAEAGHSLQVSLVGRQEPNYLSYHHCLSGCIPARSWGWQLELGIKPGYSAMGCRRPDLHLSHWAACLPQDRNRKSEVICLHFKLPDYLIVRFHFMTFWAKGKTFS